MGTTVARSHGSSSTRLGRSLVTVMTSFLPCGLSGWLMRVRWAPLDASETAAPRRESPDAGRCSRRDG